jgi:hypothetical protein
MRLHRPQRVGCEQPWKIGEVHRDSASLHRTELTGPEIGTVGIDLGVEEVKVAKANGVLLVTKAQAKGVGLYR